MTPVGLPAGTRACLFDLDGVLTRTATVHAAAWKDLFDGYLSERARATGEPFVPFDPVEDYDRYVDGRPRADGTREFLASRGVHLDENEVRELGDRKNALVLRRLRHDGVDAYEGSVRYVHAVRAAGLRTAVVSASTNCRAVLAAAGIAELFDARIDGVVTTRRGLAGKPAPDTYLEAARELGVPAGEAAVFEDALAGVRAGRAGAFGYVVGVDRVGQAADLRAAGADVVVTDLADLLPS
ncbi:hydrolase [Longispora fulva]|uniref:Beta-phosphoglucomutase n=1 Tax=Longispora fulva TaxID=619741 RepID=A0A8J7GR47_9ACTN|nr:beta-phosphoglucomutase family hydrolase [Longispora fulva]MBG6136618.1 beta-phosphoglucomutase family hydrolase [Longispora fulva]GIG59787.1 hydrolase [Longispora fulva]